MSVMPTTMHYRPLGVWILTISNMVLSVILFAQANEVLRFLPLELWTPKAMYMNRFAFVWISAIFISAWGVWFGSRISRVLLICALLIPTGLEVVESIYVIDYTMSRAQEVPHLWGSLGVLWGVSFGIRWVAWLVLNGWYFFGSRTREFFKSEKTIPRKVKAGLAVLLIPLMLYVSYHHIQLAKMVYTRKEVENIFRSVQKAVRHPDGAYCKAIKETGVLPDDVSALLAADVSDITLYSKAFYVTDREALDIHIRIKGVLHRKTMDVLIYLDSDGQCDGYELERLVD